MPFDLRARRFLDDKRLIIPLSRLNRRAPANTHRSPVDSFPNIERRVRTEAPVSRRCRLIFDGLRRCSPVQTVGREDQTPVV